MCRSIALLVALLSTAAFTDAPPPDLSGTWTLDRTISTDPATITFMPTGSASNNPYQRRTGGRGGFGGGRHYGGSSGRSSQESASKFSLVEQQRLKVLTDQLKTASASLVIAQQGSKIVVQDALKRSLTFSTDGGKTTNNLADTVIESTTRWSDGRLVTECPVADRLTLVYTYTLLAATNQLVLRVEHKEGDGLRTFDPDVKLVYVRAKS